MDDLEPWTNAQQAVYESLGRPIWALCMAWIVYACHSNLGGMHYLCLYSDKNMHILVSTLGMLHAGTSLYPTTDTHGCWNIDII